MHTPRTRVRGGDKSLLKQAGATMATSETPATRTAGRAWWLVLLAALALYTLSAQRGVAWQDSGMHQWRAWLGQLNNPLGLALAHPLYIVLAHPLRYLAGESFPTALNMLSGLGMALAVANVYLLGLRLTGRPASALVAAGMLAVAHTPWWLGTIAETYPWVVAGLSAELILLVSALHRPAAWKLALLGLVSGLGFSLHNLALLPLPVYGVSALWLAWRGRLRWSAVGWFVLAWLAGAGLYLGLIVQAGLASGDWGATIRSALFGSSWQGAVMGSNLRALGRSGIYIALNWPWLALVPVGLGWWWMPVRVGRPVGLALGAVAAIEILFAARYGVEDQFMFMLPTHVLLAVGAAVGLDGLMSLHRRRQRVLVGLVLVSWALTPVLYAAAPALLEAVGRPLRPDRRVPFRDEGRYWLVPWKAGETSARTFAATTLERVEPDAVILADLTAEYPLRLAQALRGDWPGVAIEPNPAAAGAWLDRGRPVYLALAYADEPPAALAAAYVLQPVSEGLWRVVSAR